MQTDVLTAATGDGVTVAKVGQEPGVWSAAEVARMLEASILTPADRFWREGMEGWATLDQFHSPPPPCEAFPVRFGSTFAVDPLGFVGPGEIMVGADQVEFVGHRLWPALARLGVFVAAAPLAAVLIHQIARHLPQDTAFVHFLKAYLILFEVIGSPLLVLTLMHYLCTSPASLRVPRATVSGLTCRGRRMSFLTRPAAEGLCRTRFRTETAEAAATLHGLLSTPAPA